MIIQKAGVFGSSKKNHEKRIPLHPALLSRIPSEVRRSLVFEAGYCRSLGMTDAYLESNFGGVLPRDKLFSDTDIWLLPKPERDDFPFFSKNKILWGWPHCVQGLDITQAAIDARMTVVAWEAMYGADGTHIFYRNNELAGYAAIQHMMMLTGKNGYFGRKLKAAVLGFGATARGAINSLKSLGINDITVFSTRPSYLINAPVESIDYRLMLPANSGSKLQDDNLNFKDPACVLCEYDIVVNATLQDALNPHIFVRETDLEKISKSMDIVDISCDRGMGFFFAQPTDFDSPVIRVNDKILYYSIDHTPTLYWDSASYEITKSIIDFLPLFLTGEWKDNQTLVAATEVLCGHIQNSKIIKFQNREPDFPHQYRAGL